MKFKVVQRCEMIRPKKEQACKLAKKVVGWEKMVAGSKGSCNLYFEEMQQTNAGAFY
jgi:hypothetical protein